MLYPRTTRTDKLDTDLLVTLAIAPGNMCEHFDGLWSPVCDTVLLTLLDFV